MSNSESSPTDSSARRVELARHALLTFWVSNVVWLYGVAIPLVLVCLLSAYPLHPRRWTGVLSIAGASAWLLCCPLYYFGKQT